MPSFLTMAYFIDESDSATASQIPILTGQENWIPWWPKTQWVLKWIDAWSLLDTMPAEENLMIYLFIQGKFM